MGIDASVPEGKCLMKKFVCDTCNHKRYIPRFEGNVVRRNRACPTGRATAVTSRLGYQRASKPRYAESESDETSSEEDEEQDEEQDEEDKNEEQDDASSEEEPEETSSEEQPEPEPQSASRTLPVLPQVLKLVATLDETGNQDDDDETATTDMRHITKKRSHHEMMSHDGNEDGEAEADFSQVCSPRVQIEEKTEQASRFFKASKLAARDTVVSRATGTFPLSESRRKMIAVLTTRTGHAAFSERLELAVYLWAAGNDAKYASRLRELLPNLAQPHNVARIAAGTLCPLLVAHMSVCELAPPALLAQRKAEKQTAILNHVRVH
jgi:hypothetical protein